MNKKLLAGVLISSALLSACKNSEKAEAPAAQAPASTAGAELSSEMQQVSYGIGLNLGENLGRQGVELDKAAFIAGLDDAIAGNEPKISKADIMQVMQSFQQKLMDKRRQEQEALAETNKTESEAFFAENGKKEGVMTTESGLQYEILSEGDGPIPSATDTVEVNYRGSLLSGEEFDSSYKRGQPVSFPVGGVIKGWTEALQLMKVGSKYKLYIPAELAYGPGGTGPIPPNAALVFEVELLSIKAKEPAAEAAEDASAE